MTRTLELHGAGTRARTRTRTWYAQLLQILDMMHVLAHIGIGGYVTSLYIYIYIHKYIS